VATLARGADGSLVVTETGWPPMLVLLSGAGVILFLLVETLRGGTDGADPRVAVIGGGLALLLCVVGVALGERATFRFDRRRRMLEWRRDRLFSRASGAVRFEDIAEVYVTEEPSADFNDEPRFGVLILVTASGPIRFANTTRPRAGLEEIAAAIRAALTA
jgi:hypothetical protein